MVQLKYFGDDRDYFKYDLITSLLETRLLQRYVFIPMLTDHRNDNEGKIAPKCKGDKSLRLYEFIKACRVKSLNHWETWLTPFVTSYRTVKPTDQTYFTHESRAKYWNQFKPLMTTDKTLVFVDPDTGLQTGTLAYRKKMGLEKYILNDELSELFNCLDPASILMIYQHLPFDKRKHDCSTHKKLFQVQSVCNTDLTCAYREDDLAFVFVANSKEMFKQLLLSLNKYYDKSMSKYKSIVQLHNKQPHFLTCKSGTLNSNVRQRRKETTVSVEHNKDGVITNAEKLTAGKVVYKRVLCPGCHKMIFKKWPLGWDGHAATICAGVKGGDEDERKVYFRQRFAHLFRT